MKIKNLVDGFGDIVPRQQAYLIISIIYIVFGLILTTMCIDLVGSHYIRKIHFMGRKMQDAREALEKIGTKAANVGEWMWQLRFVQKKYGLSDQALTNMVVGQVKEKKDSESHFSVLGTFCPGVRIYLSMKPSNRKKA